MPCSSRIAESVWFRRTRSALVVSAAGGDTAGNGFSAGAAFAAGEGTKAVLRRRNNGTQRKARRKTLGRLSRKKLAIIST
jgi:hypothetical protein